jgi:hypothetical protein
MLYGSFFQIVFRPTGFIALNEAGPDTMHLIRNSLGQLTFPDKGINASGHQHIEGKGYFKRMSRF